MANAHDVIGVLAALSRGIAKSVDEAPTGVKPGYRAGLGGTVLANGKLRYAKDTPGGGGGGSGGTFVAKYKTSSDRTVTFATGIAVVNWNTLLYDPNTLVTTGASWHFTAPA